MTTLNKATQQQLRQFVEAIERLEEEKKALAADIADKFAEAKAVGFDVKAMRKIIALRKKGRDERMEEEAILETYMHALGMLDQGDLFDEPDETPDAEGVEATTVSFNGGPEIPLGEFNARVAKIVDGSRATPARVRGKRVPLPAATA